MKDKTLKFFVPFRNQRFYKIETILKDSDVVLFTRHPLVVEKLTNEYISSFMENTNIFNDNLYLSVNLKSSYMKIPKTICISDDKVGIDYLSFENMKKFIINDDLIININVFKDDIEKDYTVHVHGENIFIIPHYDNHNDLDNHYDVSVEISRFEDASFIADQLLTDEISNLIPDIKTLDRLLQGYDKVDFKPKTNNYKNIIEMSHQCMKVKDMFIKNDIDINNLRINMILYTPVDFDEPLLQHMAQVLYDTKNHGDFINIDENSILIDVKLLKISNVERFKKLCVFYKINYSSILIS